MQVKAVSKHVRIAPRKARLVVDAVRGLSVVKAEERLQFMQKKGAEPVLKVLRSAVANAEHNYKLAKENLVIHSISANQGFVIRRYRARAFGRAGLIQKKTSHIAIVLDEKKPVKTVATQDKKNTSIKAETKSEHTASAQQKAVAMKKEIMKETK